MKQSSPPYRVYTQDVSVKKDYCPGHHMDQWNHSLAHGLSKSQKLWQLSRIAPLGLSVRDPHTHSIMACGLPHSRTRGESWKELETSLPLVLLIAKPSQAPTLAKATQLGLKTIAAPLVGNQRSNDTDSRVFPAPPFQHKGRQVNRGNMYFSRNSSSLLEHFLFLFQSNTHWWCSALKSLLHSWEVLQPNTGYIQIVTVITV